MGFDKKLSVGIDERGLPIEYGISTGYPKTDGLKIKSPTNERVCFLSANDLLKILDGRKYDGVSVERYNPDGLKARIDSVLSPTRINEYMLNLLNVNPNKLRSEYPLFKKENDGKILVTLENFASIMFSDEDVENIKTMHSKFALK